MVSDDEFSDLTDIDELSAEYEEPQSKKKGRGKGKSKPGEYRIRGALKAPRATTYSTEALYSAFPPLRIDAVEWLTGQQQSRSTTGTSISSPSTSEVRGRFDASG